MLFSAMLFMSVASFAQTNSVVDMKSNPASGQSITDTVTNTATVYLTSPKVAGSPKSVTVGFKAVKISGTAAGTVTLQGSNDNVDFYSASATTFTITDVATQVTSWAITGAPYLYYRVSCTGSGTSSYTLKSNVLIRN